MLKFVAGDYVEYRPSHMPGDCKVFALIQKVSPLSRTPYFIRAGEFYRWVAEFEVNPLALQSERVKSKSVSAPELFPIGGKTHD